MMHESDQPNAVVHLFDSEFLTGQHGRDIDLRIKSEDMLSSNTRFLDSTIALRRMSGQAVGSQHVASASSRARINSACRVTPTFSKMLVSYVRAVLIDTAAIGGCGASITREHLQGKSCLGKHSHDWIFERQ